ncbi:MULTISPECIES: hypothetical protein [unclassified Streptomyces]|uniref:hypothetical protein n=1 Tax=unclassified Streptomyces TaxID=2593676 RepID=UPI002E115273|nr:hypothetical protein OG457_39560 [Streptomyces sp. NBC_01207]WTA22493.1 hypothetical protein OG365_33205 [Streptomyces sp. NBC_00853]
MTDPGPRDHALSSCAATCGAYGRGPTSARRAESYLPLDPSVPPERLRRLLTEAKVDRILTQS